MNYLSTRNRAVSVPSARAIAIGLAPDGGLMTPVVLPRLAQNALTGMAQMSYQQRAVYIMNMFLDDYTASELSAYTAAAYHPEKFGGPNPAPLRALSGGVHSLELWHGPTCAFKDMALQMLPHLLAAALTKTAEDKTACILVATSGDTGKAALEGFRDVPRTRVLVFYPKDGVSEVQALQMVTQEGGNVAVCAVRGNFDDAQTGVKAIFSDPGVRETLAKKGLFLSSANSINWGRVLPQIVYYVSAYCDLLAAGALSPGDPVNFCVPTGNFGNILAAFYAKEMGLPVGRLICASNSNNVLTEFLQTGVYDKNRPFYNTISPSMDILISSNLERLIFALSGGGDSETRGYMEQLAAKGRYEVSVGIKKKLGTLFSAGFCSEEETKAAIAKAWKEHGYLIDPHTAVAFHVLEEYRAASGDMTPAVAVSTASPFKFADSVLDALGRPSATPGMGALTRLSELTGLPIPAPLAGLDGRPRRFDRTVDREEMTAAVLELLD